MRKFRKQVMILSPMPLYIFTMLWFVFGIAVGEAGPIYLVILHILAACSFLVGIVQGENTRCTQTGVGIYLFFIHLKTIPYESMNCVVITNYRTNGVGIGGTGIADYDYRVKLNGKRVMKKYACLTSYRSTSVLPLIDDKITIEQMLRHKKGDGLYYSVCNPDYLEELLPKKRKAQ